jgi:hypothetical protein
MITTYFRSSSYNCWGLCQQQYLLTYVLGIPAPSGKKAEMGTTLHKVMECLANCKLCIQNGTASFEDDALGTVPVTPDTLTDPRFVEKVFDKAYAHYTSPAKSIHKYTEADKRDIRQWCWDALQFQNGAFDPRKLTIVATEPFFDFPIDEPWAKYSYVLPDGKELTGQLRVKGTVDLITKVSDTHYEVIDWKSGECKDWGTGAAKDYVDFCKDPQLRIYHWALSQMYKEAKTFAMTINYVRTAGPFTVAYSDDDIKATMAMLRKRFEHIKSTIIPKLKSPTNQHWFCKRVCWYGKTIHPKDGTKTICQYIADKTRRCGLNTVILEETDPGHTVGYYHNPGS